jgi:hypothetical protein
MDGLVLGRLKQDVQKPTKIDRVSKFAEILPFAQRDMADSFLYGIAPELEKDIPKFLDDIIRATGAAIIKDAVKSNKKKIRDLEAKLNQAATMAVRSFKERALRQAKVEYRNEMLQMVGFMPKQELADFAESMINITSLKRHVSSQQETVAGPIDVAVISKSEGFIWVKRKHYFDAAFNPRYFMRRFGAAPPIDAPLRSKA